MKESYMIDAAGNKVPAKYVKPYDKAKDRTVRRIHTRALALRASLEAFLAESIEALDKLANTKASLGERGNFSARSFDGLLEVTVRQLWTINLDERVIKARELMLEYVNGILAEVGDKGYVLKQLVDAAFKTDRKGFLSHSKITDLMRLNVTNDKWSEGVRILQEAMQTQKGKRYFLISERKRVGDDFRVIRLDAADCWPEAFEEVGKRVK